MRRDELYLADLVQATREIARYLDGVDKRRWDDDSMVRSAVMRQLTIVGEIARATTPDMQARHADIPWRELRDFRNFAMHEYFAVNWNRVWLIVQGDVPPLAQQALEALRTEAPLLARTLEDE